MIQFKPKKQTGIIQHPGNANIQPGDIRVVVERPTAAEREMHAVKLSEFDKVEPARDPDTGRIYRDKTGNAIPLPQPVRYPIGVTIEYLKQHIKDIQGFADGDTPVQFTPANASDMVGALMEEDLVFKAKRPVPVRDASGEMTDQTEEKEVDMSFLLYVLEELHKPETYRDPLDGTNRSTTPAKSDSA